MPKLRKSKVRKSKKGSKKGSKKVKKSRKIKKAKSLPWITRKSKLGGPGFLTKLVREQHRLIDKCVKEYGYKSCLGSVMALMRNTNINAKYGAKLESLKKYTMKKHKK